MTDREYTIKFIDWTIAILKSEWTNAETKEEKRKWFDRINSALDRRCDMMKLIAYDGKVSKPAVKKAARAKADKPLPEPPSLLG